MSFHFLNSKAVHFFSSTSLSQIYHKQMEGRDPLKNFLWNLVGKLALVYCCVARAGDEFFLSLVTEWTTPR